MESQSGDVLGAPTVNAVRGQRCRYGIFRLAGLLTLWLALCSSAAWAQSASVSYVYDANGRLVAVTQDEGASAEYIYDALGNLVQIRSVPSGQLAIFAFTPAHGSVGAQVTIQGQGFDSNPANDVVMFNGVVADVSSATVTQLVTTVPEGATTGPISVTVAGQTATSGASFVVDQAALPPSIAQVSPAFVLVGNTVTVTGAHLDPVEGATRVQMGGRDVQALAQITGAQIQYVVPTNGTSGYVSVSTPYGSATSSTPVVILPSGVNASNVVTSGVATVDGPGATLNIGASGQVGVVMFDAPSSGWASLQASSIITSASSISYTVYAPGNSVVKQGTLSAASPSIHLPQLIAGATYTVLVQPSGAGAQLTLAAESNAQLAINASAAVVTTVPGQSKRVLFNATVKQNVAFLIDSTSTSPVGKSVAYTVYAPNGSTYSSGSTASTGVLNLGFLSSAGTYQVVIAPPSGVMGTMQVEAAQGAGGVLSNLPVSYATQSAGQNVYMTFSATQNENLELTFNNVSVVGARQYNQFYVYVYNGAGTEIAGFVCDGNKAGASCSEHLWYMAAGTYKVIAVPNYGGKLNFNALLQDDVVGPAVAMGSMAPFNLAAGQVERLTFNANAGDTVVLNPTGIATTPSGQSVTFAVYSPNTGQAITTSTAAYTTFSPTGSQVVNLSNLPVSGTYTVIVTPTNGLPAAGQFTVLPGVTGALTSGSDLQSYTTNVSGQNVYMTFKATQNENLELTLNNISVVGGQYNQFVVYVYDSVGRQVSSFSCYGTTPGASCSQHLWYMAAGTYRAIAIPNYGGKLNFSALLQDDVVGPAVAVGGTASFNLAAGQVERLTFNANAGDTVVLNPTGIATTPSGQSVTFAVYSPNAGQAITTGTATYTSFSPTSSQVVNLSHLPVSGSYTVIVTPANGLPASGQFSLPSDTAGSPPTYQTPSLAINGGSVSGSSAGAGQAISMTFNAEQNDNLFLTLGDLSVAGGSYLYVKVFNSGGGTVSSFTCYVSSINCRVSLWNLAAGTYTLVMTPPNTTATLSLSAQVTSNVLEPSLTANLPVSVSMDVAHQERYTFEANAGDSYALQLTDVSGQPMTALVYRPDTGAITPSGAYTSLTATSTSPQTVNLQDLPASGAYTVVVYSGNGGPSSTALLTLIPGVSGAITVDGATQAFAATTAGQNLYMTFDANQGDNLFLTLSNLQVQGGNSFGIQIYNANGVNIVGTTGYVGDVNWRSSLWNLTAGTYTLIVTPPSMSATLSLSAQVTSDILGPPLTENAPVSVNMDVAHQERYTFEANAGDSYALQLTNVSGQPMTALVYRPDTGAITPSGAYTSITATSTSPQTVNLQNLPASGIYTVVAYSGKAGPSSTALLTLIPGVSGAITVDGATQTYASTTAGQNLYMTFDANQGDNLLLTLSNLQVQGGNSFGIQIYNGDGVNIIGTTGYVGDVNWRSSLWNLAAGTYSVIVTPPSMSATLSLNAQVTSEILGPSLTENAPVSVNMDVAHQERYTFQANAGDSYALQLTDVSGQPMTALVYRPDTGAITPSGAYTSITATSTSPQTVNLQNLPASGDYTVVTYSGNRGPASAAQMTLAKITSTGGALPTAGTVGSFVASGVGQPVEMTFEANAGDNLELTLSNVTALGATTNGFQVFVRDPAGQWIANYYCYAADPGSSCTRSLWNLVPGTYAVTASPAFGGTISFTAEIARDVTGPALTTSTPVDIDLLAGQAERIMFDASQGQNLVLQLAGVSTTPTNQSIYVDVYRPDVDKIETDYAYASFESSDTGSLTLNDLPVGGTYTAIVRTGTGIPASAQLSLATP